MEQRRVAIIGAGVSGLSTAFELADRAIKQQRPIRIDIFERGDQLGGNAQTVAVSLGYKKGVPGPDNDIAYVRWADLGVNDINLAAYTTVKEVMARIGYYREDDPDTPDRMLPLENTECYFTLDGDIAYTDDADLKQGVVDARHSLQHVEAGYLARFTELMFEAAFAEIYPHGPDGEENLDITCGAFFDDCVAHTRTRLERFAQNKSWYEPSQWEDPSWLTRASGWVATLRDDVFFPRISAMYFANDYGPENMLLAAPFHYYRIQESADGKAPDRRYFVGGAQTWLEYLADHLEHRMDPDGQWAQIRIRRHTEVRVKPDQDGIDVTLADGGSERFDQAVVTTHADDALRLLDLSHADRALAAEVTGILASIGYTSSVAVCHTWSGVLPPNRNLWRAYNVLIRKGAALKPYSMTYVCNRHQNDVANPHYNLANLPQYFVTLNPPLPIPDDAILRKVPHSLIPGWIREKLPKQTLNEATRLCEENGDDRAVTTFRHNLLDKSCFMAQRRLKDYHGTATRLYFGGGWSRGSGLHEECWLQARSIAERIMGR